MGGGTGGGTIITFYSFKGGTGRSMAVANTAWVLASNGLRVLVVDWDLEAPGLHRYFHPFLPDRELRGSPGVIDLLWAFTEAAVDPATPDGPGWHEKYASVAPYTVSVRHDFPGPGTVDLVPAGRQDPTYAGLVSAFDWNNFYERLGGGGFLEALRRGMRRAYDYVLIDSRTGLSDTASICTIQLPDVLVDCFTLSTQAIDGASAVAVSADRQRRGHLRVFPVPMRVEDAEQDMRDAGLDYARARFGRLLSHLEDPDRYWGDVEVPYRTFYAYEEILAPIGDRPRQKNTVLAATERIVGYLTDGRVTELGSTLDEPDRRALLDRFRREVSTTDPAGARTRRSGMRSRVLLTSADASTRHVDAVRELWYLLRGWGVDARVEGSASRPGTDWALSLTDELTLADVVLVVVPPPDRHPAGGDDPRNGVLTADHLVRETYGFGQKPYLPVVLPGGSAADIPRYLRHIQAAFLDELSPAAIEPLIAALSRLDERGTRVPADSAAGRPRTRALTLPDDPALLEAFRAVLATSAKDWRSTGQTWLEGRGAVESLSVPWHVTSRPVPARSPGRTPGAVPLAAPGKTAGDGFRQLYETYLSVPGNQLLVLGPPGSGKTFALSSLAQQMIDDAGERAGAPVHLSAATWRPDIEGLGAWTRRAVQQIAGAVRHEPVPRDTAWRLVDGGLVVPVVDGLDELPDDLLDQALHALAEVPAEQPVVVASRTLEFHGATARIGEVLGRFTAVELEPVPAETAVAHIAASSSPTDRRWDRVFDVLRASPDGPLARGLSTPLQIELARVSFQAPHTDPSTLLALPVEGMGAALFENFVATAYSRRAPLSRAGHVYQPAAAVRWLSFLARLLEEEGSYDLAWWRLHTARPRGLSRLLLAVTGGVAAGALTLVSLLFGASRALGGGTATWLAVGVALGLLAALTSRPPRHPRDRPLLPRSAARRSAPLHRPSSPEETLRLDRRRVLLVAAAFLVTTLGAVAAVATAMQGQASGDLAATVAAAGVVPPLIVFDNSAWGWFTVTRFRLVGRGRVPWRLMRFLRDAHQRGVLRQQGSVYRFRHAELRNSLARMDR